MKGIKPEVVAAVVDLFYKRLNGSLSKEEEALLAEFSKIPGMEGMFTDNALEKWAAEEATPFPASRVERYLERTIEWLRQKPVKPMKKKELEELCVLTGLCSREHHMEAMTKTRAPQVFMEVIQRDDTEEPSRAQSWCMIALAELCMHPQGSLALLKICGGTEYFFSWACEGKSLWKRMLGAKAICDLGQASAFRHDMQAMSCLYRSVAANR